MRSTRHAAAPPLVLEFAPGRAADDGAREHIAARSTGVDADAAATRHTALLIRDETGRTRPANAEEILAAARAVLARRIRRGAVLANPRSTRDFLRLHLAPLHHELFAVLFLDNRHRVIEFVPLFRGTIDGASVHPREVVEEALTRNAAAVILAHNHPSGVAEPSQADELITARLREALALVDIRVLDHLVVTAGEIVSFAERGLL